jgi:protein TonB
MKVAHKLAVLLSLGGLLPVAALALTPEQSYLENCRKGPGIPVPISVVAPEAPAANPGSSVEIEFTVDIHGNTKDIRVKSGTDYALADAAVIAVKEWRFVPAQRDGVPVATRVVLPVRIAPSAEGDRFAAN